MAKQEKKSRTIGEAIEAEAQEYFKLYKDLQKDDKFSEGDKPKNLALHDLFMNQYKAEQVLEKVQKMIAQDEGVEQ